MTSKYTVAFVGLAFFAIAIQATSNPELKNAVADLIRDLEEKLNNLVQAGVNQFHNALVALVKVLDNILTGFLSAAQAITNPIIDQIKSISNEAVAEGLDITKCAINDVIAEIEDMPQVFLSKVQTCINTLGEAANQTIANGETELNKMVKEVGDLADEASKCNLIDIGCWEKLAAKVTSLSLSAPGKVANIISVVMKSIAGISKSAVECQTSSVDGIVAETASLLYQVTECVKNATP